MLIKNKTPYAMERSIIFDKNGNETLLVILKGTYDFWQGGSALTEEQAPINAADEYFADPSTSSIKIATDFLPTRPSTGITLCGHAVATNGQVETQQVGVRVGAVQQLALVLGDRFGYQNVDKPEPFEKIPLTWENAFGGFDQSHSNEKYHDAIASNPVGKGFIAARSQLDLNKIPLPNIEHLDKRIRAPRDAISPIGFGPISPVWEPRRLYAGTYDDEWEKEKCPLLPDDFDDRFLQVAPQQLTSAKYLTEKEHCVLLGVTEEGRLDFDLDFEVPKISVELVGRIKSSVPALESIHFNSDEKKCYLTWKSMINIQGQVEQFRAVEARV